MAEFEAFWAAFEWWWILPVAMIVLCFSMMRGRMGCMMCPSSWRSNDSQTIDSSDSAREILDKRYALGEISKEEYEEKRKDIGRSNE